MHMLLWTTAALVALPASRPALGGRAARSPQPCLLAERPSWLGFMGRKEQNWPGHDEIVSRFMKADVVFLKPEDDLMSAARILDASGITGAPVLDDGKVVGILSQTDLLYKVAGRASLKLGGEGAASVRYAENTVRLRKIEAETVASAMSRSPACIEETATMQEAAARMLKARHNRLCVVNPVGRLVGIITSSDIVRLALAEEASV